MSPRWREDRPDSVEPSPSDAGDRLVRLALFADAPEGAVTRLALASEEARYGPGKRIIREARIPSHLFVVLAGELEVWSTGDVGAEPQKVNTLGTGDVFGEVGLIEGMPSTATVITTEACRLLRIPAAVFLDVVAGSKEIAGALSRSVEGAMSRTHPSYRPSGEPGDGRLTPSGIVEQARLVMGSLEGEERASFVAAMQEVLGEPGPRD